jgi:hypothetical protein
MSDIHIFMHPNARSDAVKLTKEQHTGNKCGRPKKFQSFVTQSKTFALIL